MANIINASMFSQLIETLPTLIADDVISPAAAKVAEATIKDLNEDERKLILLFFKWLTRKNARNKGIVALETNENSQKWLKEAGWDKLDWEFAGVIDHGSPDEQVEKVCCSYGNHRLRYAYYATAIKPDGEVVELTFGKNCASDFFQIDLTVLTKLDEIYANAKIELIKALSYGRRSAKATNDCLGPVVLAGSNQSFLNILYAKTGRTLFELYMNFIHTGLYVPKVLLDTFMRSYHFAMIDYMSNIIGGSDAIQITERLLRNENVAEGEEIKENKYVIEKGEFIYPITACDFFTAVRVSLVEELYNPTVISVQHIPWSDYQRIDALMSAVNKAKEAVKALNVTTNINKVIYDHALGKTDIIHDVLSCLIMACLTNNLRYVTLFLGLTQGSELVSSDPDFELDDDEVYSWFDALYHTDAMQAVVSRYMLDNNPKRRILILLFMHYYDDLMAVFQTNKDNLLLPFVQYFAKGYSDKPSMSDVSHLTNIGLPTESDTEDYDTDEELEEDDDFDDEDYYDEEEELEIEEHISELNYGLTGEIEEHPIEVYDSSDNLYEYSQDGSPYAMLSQNHSALWGYFFGELTNTHNLWHLFSNRRMVDPEKRHPIYADGIYSLPIKDDSAAVDIFFYVPEGIKTMQLYARLADDERPSSGYAFDGMSVLAHQFSFASNSGVNDVLADTKTMMKVIIDMSYTLLKERARLAMLKSPMTVVHLDRSCVVSGNDYLALEDKTLYKGGIYGDSLSLREFCEVVNNNYTVKIEDKVVPLTPEALLFWYHQLNIWLNTCSFTHSEVRTLGLVCEGTYKQNIVGLTPSGQADVYNWLSEIVALYYLHTYGGANK